MTKNYELRGGLLPGPVTVASGQPIIARPEYIRLPKQGQPCPWTGLGRSKLWEILQTGRVRSICLRKPGALKGARLINLESLLGYLRSMEEETPPAPANIGEEAAR